MLNTSMIWDNEKMSMLTYPFYTPKELWEAYSNRTVRPSARSFAPLRVWCISYILWSRNSKLECGCILGWRSVAYNFPVTVTLTSDLVFRIHLSRAYLILFKVGISSLVYGCILGWWSVAFHNWVTVTLTLTSDLVLRIQLSGAYLLYYLRQESHIWCVDASWDDEVSHTIIGSL